MNNKKINLLAIGMCLLVIATYFSGCVEEGEVENKIIVGTSADFPPFEYVENGEIVGFDIEMVTMILENLNYTVEIKDQSFFGLVGALDAEKIDIIAAGMSITPDREKEVDFTIPYYEADLSILVRSDSNITFNESNYLDEIEKLEKIGAQTGTTGAIWIYESLINITNATWTNDSLELYDKYNYAIIDLENRNLPAVIIDKPVAETFAEDEDIEIAYTIITEEEYGLAVKKGNSELLEELNQGLIELMGSEEWTNLIIKYFE
jgi:polar amino acid transport system substrate-binding protein